MYYVKNNNVPIVSAEIFDKANELLKAQGKRYRPSTVPKVAYICKNDILRRVRNDVQKKVG